MTISRLTKVPLRYLWPHEAYDFTTWLGENLDLLGETLGMELSLIEREASAGVFAADLVAETDNGATVVIENQLERTDHDHLGKLITYLSNLDARAAVWITSEPRPEHEQAIHWLNEMLPADTAFYLVTVEAYQIADSPPAPLFKIAAGPSPEVRQIGDTKKQLASRHVTRREFWESLLERTNEKTSLFSQRSPTTETHLNAGSGKAGIFYRYVVRQNDASVGLRIRMKSAEASRRIFDALHQRKQEIEQKFGDHLDWLSGDEIRACDIVYPINVGGWANEATWPETQEAMVDAMVRLEKALAPEIRHLP